MSFAPEFQVVIMAAGKGSRMTELTAYKPKCLLPVGNKPLVWYSLHKLQQWGFKDVILVVPNDQKSQIQNVLEKSGLQIKIIYFPVDSSEMQGTADSLRLLKDKLKSDIIIFSCDLITDVDITPAVELFRAHEASITSIMLYPQKLENITVPGPKSKFKKEPDLIVIENPTKRLVFQASLSDYDNYVSFPSAFFRKNPDVKMYTCLLDSHIYIMKNWVVQYLCTVDSISTIEGELIPHVVKKQLCKPPAPKPVSGDAFIVNTEETYDIFSFAKEDDLTVEARASSSYNDHTGDLLPVYKGDPVRCYAYVADRQFYGIRVNTLAAYWAVNKEIISIWSKLTNQELVSKSPKANIKSTQVDNKCIIGDGCKIHEKTAFKNSIISNNTEVCSFSRIFDSVIMNNVVIKEKVAIESSIICNDSIIESGSQIKNCIIGAKYSISEGSHHNKELLPESAHLMEF